MIPHISSLFESLIKMIIHLLQSMREM